MNIICPHCDTETNFYHPAMTSVDHYKNNNLMKMPCCGKGVVIRMRRVYDIFAYNGDASHDDWDNELTK